MANKSTFLPSVQEAAALKNLKGGEEWGYPTFLREAIGLGIICLK